MMNSISEPNDNQAKYMSKKTKKNAQPTETKRTHISSPDAPSHTSHFNTYPTQNAMCRKRREEEAKGKKTDTYVKHIFSMAKGHDN